MDVDPDVLVEQLIDQRGGREDPVWTWLAKQDPGYMAALNRWMQGGLGFGMPEGSQVIPRKMKELLAAALLAALRDWDHFGEHLETALDLGATDQEVLEVLETAAVISGGPAIRMGIEVLVAARARREAEWANGSEQP